MRKRHEISFHVTTADAKLIDAIVKRAVSMAVRHGVKYDKLTASMDITAVHANGNPLRLRELLEADDANFGHDIFGILRFLNRETGELTRCFQPRFSQPQGGGAS